MDGPHKHSASDPPTLEYRTPADEKWARGATRPARIGAALSAVAFIVLIAGGYLQWRDSVNELYQLMVPGALACTGAVYCLLAAFGAIHRHKPIRDTLTAARMSFDLYLLPLRFWHGARAADRMLQRFDQDPFAPQMTSIDVRTAADVLRRLEPRYEPFDLDYAEIARLEKISEEQARAKYTYVELNGSEDLDPPLAQFTFHRNHVAVHWYSGTGEEEMFRYLTAICKYARLKLFDPQEGKIYGLNWRGEFK